MYYYGVQQVTNLHELTIPADGDPDSLSDYGASDKKAEVEVIFRNLERRLMREIRAADYVFGCVAWFTSERLLAALAKKRGVCVVVQKEDFLRPDKNQAINWKTRLRAAYERLPALNRWDFPTLIGSLSTSGDTNLPAVRCVGNHNSNRELTQPRMHNKFLLFSKSAVPSTADREEYRKWIVRWDEPIEPLFGADLARQNSCPSFDEWFNGYCSPFERPHLTWTGSFNLTRNSSSSFENAVLIHSSTIANAYFNEFSQIVALSEPLNWTSEWVAPEWRIGT